MSKEQELTTASAARLAAIESRLTRVIDKEYGYSIPDLILPDILKSAHDHTSVALEMFGGDKIPDDKALVETLIKNNELAQRAIGAKQDGITPAVFEVERERQFNARRPEERMAIARSPELTAQFDQQVRDSMGGPSE